MPRDAIVVPIRAHRVPMFRALRNARAGQSFLPIAAGALGYSRSQRWVRFAHAEEMRVAHGEAASGSRRRVDTVCGSVPLLMIVFANRRTLDKASQKRVRTRDFSSNSMHRSRLVASATA